MVHEFHMVVTLTRPLLSISKVDKHLQMSWVPAFETKKKKKKKKACFMGVVNS